MMIDLSAVLFPTSEMPYAITPASPVSIDVADQFIVERVVTLAFLHKYWEAGLEFVVHNVRRIDGGRLSDGCWKSHSSPALPESIFCTLDIQYPAESCEAVIHEASHLALYRLEKISPLQTSEMRTYRHAWKPDLRDARGALLAAHAFLNVSDFYLHLSRFREYSHSYSEAVETLNNVKHVITQLKGGENLSGMGRVVSLSLEEQYLKLTGEIA